MNRFKALFAVFLVCLIVIELSFISRANSHETDYTTKKIGSINEIEMGLDKTIVKTKLGEVNDISIDVAFSHEYEIHVFDCTDFSMELVKRLRDFGLKAICIAGNNWNFEYPNHTWVRTWIDGKEIEIEATSGEIIKNPEEEGYEVWKEDYCW